MDEIFDKCPKCGCEDLENTEQMFENGEVTIRVDCQNDECDYRWLEVYNFAFNADWETGERLNAKGEIRPNVFPDGE